MNLSKVECERLSTLLQDKKINLPDFRRSVTPGGGNVLWLKKNIQTRNQTLHPEIKKILQLN